jgi:phosphoribosylglycinamide formyltransferase-1
LKIGIFISGTGTNMSAIIKNFKAGLLQGVGEISFVLSDKSNAGGIIKAQEEGITTIVLPKHKNELRSDYELRLLSNIFEYGTEIIVLAGFMKLLGNIFLNGYKGKIINIHPSLLPSFKGVNAQKQAFDYGVRISGCTTHFVDETLDGGPIILQAAVERKEDDTYETFKNRILAREHKILSESISIVATGRYSISHRMVLLDRRSYEI